jgi:hypothetical protein
MGVQIYVFVDNPSTTKQKDIIEKISNDLVPLVDAKNKNNTKFLKEYFQHHSCFFYVSEFISRCTPEELEFSPDIAITLDHKATEKEWICIERYLESCILCDTGIHTDPTIAEKGKKLLQTHISPAPLLLPPQLQTPSLPTEYNLRTKELPDRDCMLVEIEKPFCDLPYTILIRNFKTKGFKPVFTDLFICQSWGVARNDYTFLSHLWKHWFQDEPYDLDKMLHEATQRCFPNDNQQPEPEPEVFRRPIENVLQTLQNREEGIQELNQDTWNQQRLKKRKLDDQLLLE